MRTQHAMINIVSLHLGHATDAENPDQELKRQLAEMKKTNADLKKKQEMLLSLCSTPTCTWHHSPSRR